MIAIPTKPKRVPKTFRVFIVSFRMTAAKTKTQIGWVYAITVASPAGTVFRAVNEDPLVSVTLRMPIPRSGKSSRELFGRDSRLIKRDGNIAPAPTSCLKDAKTKGGEKASPIFMKMKEVPHTPNRQSRADFSLRFRV